MIILRLLNDYLLEPARPWCQGRNGIWRLGLLGYFLYILFGYCTQPNCWTLFEPMNLAIHEIGHILFSWAGQFIMLLGGSFVQCLAPVAAMINFNYQQDYFAIALSFGWLATNFFGVARYIADARAMQLPLVTVGGGEPMHDWNTILTHMGLLGADTFIAGIVFMFGLLSMGICLVYGGWLIKQMMIKPREI